MKVSLVNHSDINGGAAIATYRIHNALLQNDINSTLYVNQLNTNDLTVYGNKGKYISKIRQKLGSLLLRTLHTENSILHSPAIIPSGWPKLLNESEADIIHLNWINHEMLSISDIKCIRKPLVWTLHDMWAFCGAEHVSTDNRWKDGYSSNNRPNYESGFDLNRWTWKRKLKYWKKPIHIVTPSRWLGNCVRQSKLMHDWPITVVPNPIDINIWKPINKKIARDIMGLPFDSQLIAFGTYGGNDAHHKGFDLMKSSLDNLHGQLPGLEVVVFGNASPEQQKKTVFPIHHTGHFQDIISLRLLYSAIDLMVIPSRIDNFPNTAVEAMACGTPIVAFNVCGLPDIVDHKQNGYLANGYDAEDLANGIKWVLTAEKKYQDLCISAREKVITYFNNNIIAKKYIDIYNELI